MNKFMLLSMKRTGSNHLLNSLQIASKRKMVWFDAQPNTWGRFDLSFQKADMETHPTKCLDELYDHYSGCKINWDEPMFYSIIDELLEYPIQKILLHRENIWEKVISEELAIQTNHWVAPIGRHRVYKEGHKFDAIDVDIVRQKIDDVRDKMGYFLNFIDDDFIVYSYEDLFSRNSYTDKHRNNFCDLLGKLDIDVEDTFLNDIIGDLMVSEKCYKTDKTYELIPNIEELRKLDETNT